ncbi:MAG: cupredoxin domain-containing protein [Candidatus Aenigmarchaeota archaeon]|nr:cupredoxin domain-containing protein [Candidatus Aenigmarchaeota archaeon]
MNKLMTASILIFAVFVAGCTSSQSNAPTAVTGVKHTVEITNTGFNPNTLNIKLGDDVTFVNKDASPHWPASNIHPTHCEYKGCNVFDSRKGLNTGESYSIVFDQTGTWKYHDHLNPGMTGTLIVQ